jgi:hypothetical protein
MFDLVLLIVFVVGSEVVSTLLLNLKCEREEKNQNTSLNIFKLTNQQQNQIEMRNCGV